MSRGLPFPKVVVRVGPYLLLATLFVLRLAHPRADPPVFLDWSGGLFFDEGAYAHNARNKLLFGEWQLDRWNNMYYSPLHNYLVYLSFSLLGVGFLQERLIPITLSGLSLLLFYLLLKDAFGLPTALTGTVLLGTNYFFVMFGRLGLLEIPVTFAAILTLYCFGKGIAGRGHGWFFLAGASSFLVYVFKNIGVYFTGAALATALYEGLNGPKERRWGTLGGFLGGLGSSVLLWAVAFYLPNREALASIGSLWLAQSLPTTLSRSLTNFLTQPVFVYLARTRVVVLLGSLGLFLVLYLFLRKRELLHGVEILAATWVLSGLLFLSLLSYRPVRYYVPLIPPLCLLAARLVIRSFRPLTMGAEVRRDPLLYLLVLLSAITVSFYDLLPSLRLEISLGTRFLLSLPIAGVGLAVATLLLRPWSREEVRFRAAVGLGLGALLLLSVGLDLHHYWQWRRDRSYVMASVSRELGRRLDRAVIAGLATPALVLENRHRAVYAGREGWFDATLDLFQRYPDISHLFLATYNRELNWYYQAFPEIMARARLLKIYRIWQSDFFLFSLRGVESARPFHPTGNTEGYDGAVHSTNFPFTVHPGQLFQATIAMRNTGSQPWRADDGISLGARDDKDPFAAQRHPLPPAAVVEPQQVVTSSLHMRAPSRPGLYVSDWQLVKEGAFWFGEPFLTVIWVKERS